MSQSTTGAARSTPEFNGLSAAVVEAVARAEGVDPTALEEPLYEVVDPDALDDLTAVGHGDSPTSQVRIYFTYYGYEVEVRGDGEVVLERE